MFNSVHVAASHADLVEERLRGLQITGGDALLRNGRKGLEKESLRVTERGAVATTDHPRALGSALTHPYITTDYSEALPEFVTPSFTDVAAAERFLHDLHVFTQQALDGETLWAASMPCCINDDSQIRIAEYGSSNIGRMKHLYRVGLDYRYGRLMQAIAGVHFNYSLPAAFWPVYQEEKEYAGELRDFIDDEYFGMVRNFKRHAWLLLYLFGNSPAVCKTFLGGRTTRFKQLDPSTYYMPHATSLRMSDIGYKNKNQAALHVSYDDLEDYVCSLKRALVTPFPEYEALGVKNDGEYIQLSTSVLQIENEFYSLVRPKRTTKSGERPTTALRERGVEYVEIRALDLQIDSSIGVVGEHLRFIEALLILCLLDRSPALSADDLNAIGYNELTVALRGREPGIRLVHDGVQRKLTEWAREICRRMQGICEILDGDDRHQPYSRALRAVTACVDEPDRLPSARLLATLRETGASFTDYVLAQSLAHKRQLLTDPLDKERRTEFERLAKESLAEQARLEASDTLSFEAFLSDYYEG
jgi:glutamate--cysteine ligase